MKTRFVKFNGFTTGVFGMLAILVLADMTHAHCDTMDGPVVRDAQVALDKGDVTGVLKWISEDNEAEIREAFRKTQVVRTKGPEAKALADMYFFETVVRLHRAGEGAPYTGLKPAGTEVSPVVVRADDSLLTEQVDTLAKRIVSMVEAGIRQRFEHALEARKHAEESIEAGRKYVAAYVEYVHYVEHIHQAAAGAAAHHSEASEHHAN